MNVLDYMEDTPRALLKQVITVKRSQLSKFLFYLLVRHYRIELRKRPLFFLYNRVDASSVRGYIEEIALFGGEDMFVLEGFPSSFVSSIMPPKGVYILAETEDGELETPLYSYKQRRGAIKMLMQHLGIKLSLREVLGLNWGSVRDYTDVEMVLRKAAAAGWGAAEIDEVLKEHGTGNILLMLKKGYLKDICDMKERYADGWIHKYMVRSIPQMATYRALVSMGQSANSIMDTLAVSNYKLRALEEAAQAVSTSDLKILATRVMELDGISLRNPRLAADLLVLKSGIALRR